jgi:hypothetical protein
VENEHSFYISDEQGIEARLPERKQSSFESLAASWIALMEAQWQEKTDWTV